MKLGHKELYFLTTFQLLFFLGGCLSNKKATLSNIRSNNSNTVSSSVTGGPQTYNPSPSDSHSLLEGEFKYKNEDKDVKVYWKVVDDDEKTLNKGELELGQTENAYLRYELKNTSKKNLAKIEKSSFFSNKFHDMTSKFLQSCSEFSTDDEIRENGYDEVYPNPFQIELLANKSCFIYYKINMAMSILGDYSNAPLSIPFSQRSSIKVEEDDEFSHENYENNYDININITFDVSNPQTISNP